MVSVGLSAGWRPWRVPRHGAGVHGLGWEGTFQRSDGELEGTTGRHRVVWAGRDLLRPSGPAPCRGQGHLPLDQLAQSPVQPGLKEV